MFIDLARRGLLIAYVLFDMAMFCLLFPLKHQKKWVSVLCILEIKRFI